MDPKYIDEEIARHLERVPDAHPETVERYRRLLIELNQNVTDPELMFRPDGGLMPYVPYELRRLEKKLKRPIARAVTRAADGPVDPYERGILQAMYDVEKR